MKKEFSLKKLFDDNRFLTIFAIVAAVLLYIIVAMINDNYRTKIIRNVPVNIDIQSPNLTNQNLTLVTDIQYTVDIEVMAPLTEIGNIDSATPELATTVNVSNIVEPGTYTLPMVSGYEGDLSFQIVNYSPQTIDLRFDRMKSQLYPIKPVIKGLNTPAPYVFDGEYANPERVSITGPDTELALIHSVEVNLELTEPLESTRSVTLPILLKDVQGEIINPDEHHLTLETSSAQLVITVHKETELPIEIGFTSQPRGFPVDELRSYMTLSVESLVVSGPEADVDRLTEIIVGFIDISNLRLSDNIYTYPLELPETLNSRENLSSVTVRFETTTWDSALFNISEVQAVSPPYHYDVKLLSTRLDNVEFIGDADILASMTSDDIVAEVDLSERELTLGQTNYPVKISVPGKGLVWAVGDYSVLISVTETE